MKKILVGSVESGDLMITISKNNNSKNNIQIGSKFLNQFGDQIREIVEAVLKEIDAVGYDIDINDQGAIPAVIRARVKTAVERINRHD